MKHTSALTASQKSPNTHVTIVFHNEVQTLQPIKEFLLGRKKKQFGVVYQKIL